jgi:hypothetical protein
LQRDLRRKAKEVTAQERAFEVEFLKQVHHVCTLLRAEKSSEVDFLETGVRGVRTI